MDEFDDADETEANRDDRSDLSLVDGGDSIGCAVCKHSSCIVLCVVTLSPDELSSLIVVFLADGGGPLGGRGADKSNMRQANHLKFSLAYEAAYSRGGGFFIDFSITGWLRGGSDCKFSGRKLLNSSSVSGIGSLKKRMKIMRFVPL